MVDEDDAVTNLEAVSYISYNASFGPVGRNSECLVNLKSLISFLLQVWRYDHASIFGGYIPTVAPNLCLFNFDWNECVSVWLLNKEIK